METDFSFKQSLKYLSEKIKISENNASVLYDICHYTSFDVIHNIFKNKELWASHVSYMNDPGDGFEMFDMVIKMIDQMLIHVNSSEGSYYHPHFVSDGNTLELSPAQISFSEKLNDHDIVVLHQIASSLSDFRSNRVSGYSENVFDVYVVSFVPSSMDDLSAWRGYANDGRGVKIKFDLERLKESLNKNYPSEGNTYEADPQECIKFLSCKYLPQDEMQKISFHIVKKIVLDMKLFSEEDFESQEYKENQMLMMNELSIYSLSVKDSSYESEKEVRFIFDGMMKSGDDISYRGIDGMLVPFKKIKFDLSAISGVVCGPRSDFRSVYSIRHMLEKYSSLLFNFDDNIYREESDFHFVCRSKIKYFGR